jgi:hypothetical protein
MSGFDDWIEGQAEKPANCAAMAKYLGKEPQRSSPECGENTPVQWQELPKHDFGNRAAADGKTETERKAEWERDRELCLYRKKTTALLRRYMRWSLEAGRLPSLLGRELFRTRITAYSSTTFESRVIFLHDVEGCLDRLQDFDRQIIARVILQEYDHEAAARILQCDRRTIERRLPELIDELTLAFLRAELLDRLPETKEDAL